MRFGAYQSQRPAGPVHSLGDAPGVGHLEPQSVP